MIAGSAHLIVGLLILGCGLIFFAVDRHSPTSRPLALCLAAAGAAMFVDAPTDGAFGNWMVPLQALSTVLEVAAMVAGVEWGRRIGSAAGGWAGRTVQILFRVGQALFLVYGLLILGYLMLRPDLALSDAEGIVRVRPIEFAIFAPVIGTAILASGLAIIILMFLRIDSAEKIRLRSIFFSGIFFLIGLVVGESLVPLTMALGLLVLLAGAMRYLMIQGRRGQFMSQFLSPQVAELVRSRGLEQALRRERRLLSVVACDLRGFTAFARQRSSDDVVAVLERYYDQVGEVAAHYGGTIKDHAGDGVLILVGAPLQVPDHARLAVLTALEIIEKVAPQVRAAAESVGLGVGVATGKLTIGAIQGAGRLEYVAVGNAVNLAARLCDRAADGEVLADQRTAAALLPDDPVSVEQRPPEALKGYPQPVPVVALRPAAVDARVVLPRRDQTEDASSPQL